MSRKAVILTLVILPLVLQMAVSQAEDRRAHQLDPAKTTIMGVAAGDKEHEIIKALGKPKSVTRGYSELEDKPTKYLQYEGAKIHIIDGSIYGLSCVGAKCATDRGIGIGDTKAKVIEAYGEGNPPYAEGTRDTLSYPLTGSDSYLVFVFDNGKVVEIEFFMDFA